MRVPSARGDYRVELTRRGPLGRLDADGPRIFLIDREVWRLHGRGALKRLTAERRLVLPATEHLKTLAGVGRMAAAVLGMNLTRRTRIVAIGGGTLQDAAGFLASIVHRGLSWDFVPTTLLAQADSCIGGKTSINHHGFKNVLGTFHPPRKIVLWPGFLTTLAGDDFLSGVGEVAKLHLLAGAQARRLWERSRLEVLARDAAATEKLTWSSLAIKRRYLVQDEFDAGVRQYLNFGHCFGHAIEAATAFRVPHGQAVTLGMELAGYLGVARGLMREEIRQRVFERYLAGVRTTRVRLTPALVTHVIKAMGRDKKRIGKGLAVIVLDNALDPIKLTDVTEREARAAFARWRQ
ncbi:MAG: hypothetical protein WBD07_10440 [Vicinamibacterales bacterium]